MTMKWNRFVVTQTTSSRQASPYSRIASSRPSSRNKPATPFTLKSCQKVKLTPSPQLDHSFTHKQRLISDSQVKNMISKVSCKSQSRHEQRKPMPKKGSMATVNEVVKQAVQEVDNLAKVFYQELQSFMNGFFAKFEEIKVSRSQGDEFRKLIIDNFQDNLTRYLEKNQAFVFKVEQPIKKKTISQNESPVNKQGNRVIQFKNQKLSEQNGIYYTPGPQVIQDSPKRQKFERTSRNRRSRRQRSIDSSAQDIMQRSLNQSYRSSKSRLKAKQALYQFSKVLNHD